MVEVFKTNVKEYEHAEKLVYHIHQYLDGYKANFDLDDCDRILRIEYAGGIIEPLLVVDLVKNSGFIAEVLSDEHNL